MKETNAKWGSAVKGIGLDIVDFFDQGIESYMPGINEILHVKNTDALQTSYSDFTDYTGFGYTNEGDNAPEQSRYKGFDSKFVVDDYSGVVYVTQNSIDDNNFSQALDAVKAQARNSMRFRDQLGYQLFNAGFDTNAVEKNGFKLNWFGDDKPQFSVQHPSSVPGGSTQSNASGSGIVLSEDNIEVAEIAMEDQNQDNGEMLDFSGTKAILVPHNLRRTAKIINETESKVGTDYNDINIYNGLHKLIISKYFGTGNGGSATAWYYMDDNSHMLNYIVRQDESMGHTFIERNKTHEYVISGRGTAASMGWKATWASKGDAAAYTA